MADFSAHFADIFAHVAGAVASVARPVANVRGAIVDITRRFADPRGTLVDIAGQLAHCADRSRYAPSVSYCMTECLFIACGLAARAADTGWRGDAPDPRIIGTNACVRGIASVERLHVRAIDGARAFAR